MARRAQTYAIRLAVEGGGQVKAELVSVGQSGEQSLKRIETAGDKASGGLKGLGRQAELLRTGIRTLGGALIGAATVGGLGALIDRSISAADAIGKTADKIGVGVGALQELRFAAKASGVEQQTLDMALQRFTRRAAEAAQGTGEAKDALAQMGIALRDQSGNLRRSEDLLGDVADAFALIEDPAERVRLAFKLFDSEGVALVNLLRGGSDALDEMRERARDLGIVLDEHLVRDAERARTELDTLSQVISANLTRAALEAAPVIADLSSWLADVAGKAGIAWERLFDAPEAKSLRTVRYELDLASATIEKLEGRIEELRESPTLGFTTFIDTAQINALQTKIDELSRARDQTQARIAFLEGPPDTGAPAPASAPPSDDTAGVQDRAKNLERITRELEGTLFGITHEGSARIIAEHERRIAEIEALRARDGSNAQQVDQLIGQSAAVREAQLSQLRAKEVEAAEKVRAANERVVASLGAERTALSQTERERFVAQALSRLSAEATAQQRREVEQLAGALFDEQQALQARQRLLDEGRSVIDRTRTATEQHAAEVQKLNELLSSGAIDQASYARAVEDANDRALRSGQAWTDGATRFLKDYIAESQDAATATEQAFARAFGGAEDALVGFVTTGKLEFQSLADSILADITRDITRMAVRQTITAPLAGALQSAFAGGGLFGAFHRGGVVGERPLAVRYADAALFEHAPRYHGGGFAGSGLLPDEVPIIARRGELIAFFRARRGKAYGFRFKDWTDYKAIGQLLGAGDAALTQFQLVKHYPSGSVIEVRTITKPVDGTVKVYLDSVEQLAGWSVDTTTGIVTFGTPPALGVEVTADFEFDVPVRFDTDHMAVTIETFQLHNWQQIPIVELRT